MQVYIKHFKELSLEELYDILKLRVSVFVVEQNCPYQEIDDYDQNAYHIFFKDEEGIQAYLRVLDKQTKFPYASFGRVIAVKRRSGLGTALLAQGIQVVKEVLHEHTIMIEAQVYAKAFYEQSGFHQVSDEYLEDGIPHIHMRLAV